MLSLAECEARLLRTQEFHQAMIEEIRVRQLLLSSRSSTSNLSLFWQWVNRYILRPIAAK